MWLKVDNNVIDCKNLNCQLTLDEGANIFVEVDINANPDYSKIFISKYEMNKKFNIESTNFSAFVCYIKRLDILFNKSIEMDIICEKIDIDISKRRDKIIDDILNQDKL